MAINNPTSFYIKRTTTFLSSYLFLLGLWKPYKKPAWIQIVYSTYSTIFLTIFSIIYTASLVCDIFYITDFNYLANRLFMSLTELALVFKVVNFYFNTRDLQEILHGIKEYRIKSIEEENTINFREKIFRYTMGVYYTFPNLTCITLSIVPLYNGAKGLVFSACTPGFDWKCNRQDYWAVYIYQAVGIMLTGNLNVTIDTYHYYLLHMFSAHINIYGHRLSSIKVENGDSAEKIRSVLIKRMHAHQRLNATYELIQKKMQLGYFCQILMSGVVICSTTRELARVNLLRL